MADARRKALLVEDEVLVAMVAEEHLGSIGFDAICAETAEEALRALAADPDLRLAVIDIGLPDMRGDDLAVQIRAAAPDIMIVMATGYDGAPLRARFAGDARLTVLSKPYSESDLRKAVASLEPEVLA